MPQTGFLICLNLAAQSDVVSKVCWRRLGEYRRANPTIMLYALPTQYSTSELVVDTCTERTQFLSLSLRLCANNPAFSLNFLSSNFAQRHGSRMSSLSTSFLCAAASCKRRCLGHSLAPCPCPVLQQHTWRQVLAARSPHTSHRNFFVFAIYGFCCKCRDQRVYPDSGARLSPNPHHGHST